MTNEEIETLVDKHSGVSWVFGGCTSWSIDENQIAALISEVEQRVARECAETEIYVDPSDMTNLQRRWHSAGVEALRGAIRTMFLTGEEGK